LADLGPSMKPMVMPSYPHMMAEDTEVWSKYLAAPVAPIKELWYDVHVGESVGLPAGAADIDYKIARAVTRKRIDVVCRVGGGFWVVEVKPYANQVALGQVLNYTRLFIVEYRPEGEVWPVVVCDNADRDLLDDFELLGVVCIVV